MSTHNIPFLNMKKKIILNYPKSAKWDLFQGTQGVRNSRKEPSVFEPLKFYCICTNEYCLLRSVSCVLSAVYCVSDFVQRAKASCACSMCGIGVVCCFRSRRSRV